MRKIAIILLCLFFAGNARSQRVESIHFNLYTDSLKRGFYNYISVDGRLSDGRWLPLDSTQLVFSAKGAGFKGNDLFLDSSYVGDSILVRAALRQDPMVWKEVVIYIRKRGFDEPLRTNDEFLNDLKTRPKRKKERQG